MQLRITVLAYRDPREGVDRVVPRVVRALESNGHTVSVLTVNHDIHRLVDGLRARRPDLIFNLLEQFGDREIGSDVAVVGILDLLEIPYTGGGPGEFYLTGDKSLTKKVLAFDSIRYPDFAVCPRGFEEDPSIGRLRAPLFVKPMRLDASIGIDAGALVRSTTDLTERVKQIHEQCDDDALVEEYIEGREIYVGVLGNEKAIAFPPIEMDFSGLPEGAPKVMDAKAKFDETSTEYHGTRPKLAELDHELAARVEKVALAACRALRVRDYGRVDMRVDEGGQIYVLEVNASCYLDEEGEFVMGAKAAGIEYDQLIQRIVDHAMDRCRFPGFPGRGAPRGDHCVDLQPKLRAASRVVSTEYFVACTGRLPERAWDESYYGPVAVTTLPAEDDIRLQLEARLDGAGVTEVVMFSTRARGHLAFQFATALAKMSAGVVFDDESLDEPLADYRGYPSIPAAGGIEKRWQSTIDSEARALQLRCDQEDWDSIGRIGRRDQFLAD